MARAELQRGPKCATLEQEVIMSTTILFATDFSDSSQAARQLTRALARHLGARVVCAHAAMVPIYPASEHDVLAADFVHLRQLMQEELAVRDQRLQEIASELGKDGIAASTRVVEGAAVESICSAAQEAAAALVIVGSHGRTGLKRIVLGSVAERVVRTCETSVLVARPPVIDQAGFRRVLVPTDFSQAAEVALDQAVTMAAEDAVIDILHCWTADEFADGWLRPIENGRPVTVPDAAARARELGESWVKRVGLGHRRVAFHLVADRPTAGIQTFLDEQAPYDLVAVGTHGRTGMQRLFIGSVAESTVRYAPCSVLVARPRAA
jgi:nucleotide-binding universal stress UspA family protein